jgi:hypothetical protein
MSSTAKLKVPSSRPTKRYIPISCLNSVPWGPPWPHHYAHPIVLTPSFRRSFTKQELLKRLQVYILLCFIPPFSLTGPPIRFSDR